MVGYGVVAMRLIGVLALVALFSLQSAAPTTAATAAKQYDERLGVLTVRSFDLDEPWIALTFDTGTERGETAHILEILRDNGVHVSFGITGLWAQANPDLVRQMVRDGHTLINHGWDHQSFTHISSAERDRQLRHTEDTVRDIAGVELQPFFRPPFDDYDDATLADLKAHDYAVNVLWSLDSGGSQGGDPVAIAHHVSENAVPGSIVRMSVNSESHDVLALALILDHLEQNGFRFATLSDFILGSLLPMRYFPATGYWVKDNMLAYWDAFGGLPVFGYPISEPMREGTATLQFFERARFEYRPGVWPARYDVQLGLLGVELTASRVNEQPFRRVVAGTDANCTFYPETGHRSCFAFRAYWQTHGGLAILGYPISEEFVEDGYTVQYFERARFEWHPENQPPWNVLLADLGRQALKRAQ
jgi:peptidoglycan/xylan/chitin deacetylase (PgdA/CDA1 family)